MKNDTKKQKQEEQMVQGEPAVETEGEPSFAKASAGEEEWKNKYLRALADYQNLERRTREEKQEIRLYAGEVLLVRLLPVVDTFEKAAAHLNDAGLGLALKQLQAFLIEQGVEKLNVVGKSFNPHEMECVEVVAGEDNIVVEEMMPGYMLRGKILRVAQVKVGKKGGN
jgi:molecular chaperone GrpE